MKLFFARIFSWLVGRKIGDAIYTPACPHIIGGLGLLLPSDLHTKEERNTTRYRVRKEVWTGFRWEFVGVLELPQQEFQKLDLFSVTPACK